MTASALVAPLVRRRGKLGHYALWQARDFGWNIAIVSTLLFAMVGYLMHLNFEASMAMAAARGFTPPPEMQLRLFSEVLSMFVTVGPIIALSGVVSTDRSSGYTRFLFAKPVSPVLFYAQSLLVRFAGYLAIGAVLMLVWGHYHIPHLSWQFLADAAICFISIGGVVFLASVLSRFDGLVAIVFLLISAVVWGKWGDVTGFKHYLTWIVSPSFKFGEIHNWMLGVNNMGALAELPFPTKWVVWNLGYGLACVLLGLVMLRRIPLTKA